MKLRSLLVGLFLLVASFASAQTATPSNKLAWDIDAPTPATAQSYTYRHYDDGSGTGVILTSVVCVGTGVSTTQTCTAAMPAFTPGSHTLTATASNAAGESLPSTPFPFTFIVVPNTPRNLRIVP